MRTMGARLLSFLSCRAYGKFGMTAVMRLADAVRPMKSSLVNLLLLFARARKCARGPTCVYHNKKFHETIVDVAWCCGLDNEDVLVSYGLAHCDAGLLVGVVQAHGLCNLNAQPASRI